MPAGWYFATPAPLGVQTATGVADQVSANAEETNKEIHTKNSVAVTTMR
jgi:hypothetical protein